MKIHFPKLYRYDRNREHCCLAVPFKKGEFRDEDEFAVLDGEVKMPVQTKVTSRYEDGSIRYLFVRFMADLPANKKKDFEGVPVKMGRNRSGGEDAAEEIKKGGSVFWTEEREAGLSRLAVERKNAQIIVKGGKDGLEFAVSDNSSAIFDYVDDGRKRYTAKQFEGPYLMDQNGRKYGLQLKNWRIVEEGPLVCVLRCEGVCAGLQAGKMGLQGRKDMDEDASQTDLPESTAVEELPQFDLKLTAYAEKPWVEVAYRLINTTDEVLQVASLVFGLKYGEASVFNPVLANAETAAKGDPYGEGSMVSAAVTKKEGKESGEKSGFISFPATTTGIKDLPQIEKAVDLKKIRTCVGNSNYKTNFTIDEGNSVERIVDAKFLMGEANEHAIEVLYGTFFADVTDERAGVCATVFQAQQNFPKAVKADPSGIYVMLVPEGEEKVVMQSGMSREQRFLLHFHAPDLPLWEVDNRSLIYQMPDKPWIDPEAFKNARVMPDIFVDEEKKDYDVELSLIAKCDSHTRALGMMNFGDAPDPGYTRQGRGKGMQVWTNNEYDYVHACALIYARTGIRRFQDYMIAAGWHQMDVDVCHYSKDPLLFGGQWEHTRGHSVDGCMVCSHQWVEGLIDLYHFTGDERAFETAIGIGENVQRLLETPMYQVSGESNARETGWALRALTALYVETHDKKWIEKAEWIIGHFKEWSEEYGEWIAPYTDNTAIRVGFMISVAVGSLMRYYRVFPEESLKDLILDAVDDVLENCLLDNGLFFYKELPSLNYPGGNTLLLEAMTIGYELTGDTKYLKAGKKTFQRAIQSGGASGGGKSIVEDAVIMHAGPTKAFAQSFVPLSVFYKALVDNGML